MPSCPCPFLEALLSHRHTRFKGPSVVRHPRSLRQHFLHSLPNTVTSRKSFSPHLPKKKTRHTLALEPLLPEAPAKAEGDKSGSWRASHHQLVPHSHPLCLPLRPSTPGANSQPQAGAPEPSAFEGAREGEQGARRYPPPRPPKAEDRRLRPPGGVSGGWGGGGGRCARGDAQVPRGQRREEDAAGRGMREPRGSCAPRGLGREGGSSGPEGRAEKGRRRGRRREWEGEPRPPERREERQPRAQSPETPEGERMPVPKGNRERAPRALPPERRGGVRVPEPGRR